MVEQEPMTPEVAVMILKTDPERPGSPSLSLRAEAVATLAMLVDQNVPEWVDMVDDNGRPQCWHFVGYRPGAAALGKHEPWQLNQPEEPQYQGVIFADGTVAMRWLTARRSHSVWASFAEMFDVHGHPEYGTEIRWPDGAPQEAQDVIADAVAAWREREAERAEAEAEERRKAVGGVPLLERESLAQLEPGATRQDLFGDQLAELRAELDARTSPAGAQFERMQLGTAPAPLPEDDTGKTLVVCLDCPGVVTEGGGHRPLIVPLTEKSEADGFVRAHMDNHPDHRVVTVPGWPPPGQAIAYARHHGPELHAGGDR